MAKFFGCKIYLFSPSIKCTNAIRAFLFGSYSIELTIAGTLYLFRLKSIKRYCFLCPPPLCLIVITPRLFLPFCRWFFRIKLFSGLPVVISEKDERARLRVPGVYAL